MRYKLTNRTKMSIALGCMVAYGLIYREFMKNPLLTLVTDLPPVLQSVSILLAVSPIWIFGACAVGYYLKSQKTKDLR